MAIKLINLFTLETSQLLSREKEKEGLIKIYDDNSFEIKPTSDNVVDQHFKNLFKKYEVKGQFLFCLKNCFLVTEWFIPVTSEGEIIIETSGKLGMLVLNIMRSKSFFVFHEYGFLAFVVMLRVSRFFNYNFFKKIKEYDSLFHIVPRHGYSISKPAFSHWIFENLPQVRMYFEAIKHSNKCELFIGNVILDWQELTLNLLGVNKKSIISNEKSKFIKIKNLYLSRLPYIHSNEVKFDPEGRNWVRETLRKNIKEKYLNSKDIYNQKIVFSRKFCHRRKILNDDSFYEFFREKDFKIIHPEEFYEIDKIINSYKSNYIIGFPSGSALANMIFARKGNILEILGSNKSSFISVWFLLAKELKMQYFLFLTDEVQETNDFRENNLIVNFDNFKSFLNKLDIKKNGKK